MRSASVAFKAHLAGENTTLCRIWKVTRTDGEVFGFSEHDQPITYGGVIYDGQIGGSVSAFVTGSSLAVDNAEVAGFFASAGIVEADLVAGAWDFAEVEVYLVNWADMSMGAIEARKGWLGEASIKRGQFVVELRGMMQKLQQAVGRMYGALCDADLGDARCGITLATFTNARVTTPITAKTSDRVFTATGLNPVTNWYKGGTVEFMSGANVGLLMEVKSNTSGGEITLQMPMPRTVAITDSIKATMGCLKRRVEDCYTVFNNAERHRGFDLTPGLDRVLSGQ